MVEHRAGGGTGGPVWLLEVGVLAASWRREARAEERKWGVFWRKTGRKVQCASVLLASE